MKWIKVTDARPARKFSQYIMRDECNNVITASYNGEFWVPYNPLVKVTDDFKFLEYLKPDGATLVPLIYIGKGDNSPEVNYNEEAPRTPRQLSDEYLVRLSNGSFSLGVYDFDRANWIVLDKGVPKTFFVVAYSIIDGKE